MRILEQEAVILGEQEPGIIGMKKRIELCARLCYKTEDRITEDSYERFVSMLYNRGHWNALSFGTVYLKVPKPDFIVDSDRYKIFQITSKVPFTKINADGDFLLITTNYRIICQSNAEDIMEKYWCEPYEKFYHRVTGKFICSRATANQLVRHRAFCMLQESQRYVNYSKFDDGEVGFIIPAWAYNIRDMYAKTFDTVTGELHEYIKHYNGKDMWNELINQGYSAIKKRNDYWINCEKAYLEAILDGLKPEEARGVLCNDTKTELYMCGYVNDWIDEPEENSKEKCGFFYLRTAKDAQADVRELTKSLQEQFKNVIKYEF